MSVTLELPLHREMNPKQLLLKWRDNIFGTYERRRLKQKSFVVLSNNCWGYELYGATRREYNTPFIGLFMMPECYLTFLENFEQYIEAELHFVKQSKYYTEQKSYPIGLLGGVVEIHFLHYASEKEARDKWNRRLSRLKLALASGAQVYVKICDCEGCTTEHLARFHRLAFKYKISIGLQPFAHSHHVHAPHLANKSGSALVDGAKLFKKRYSYFDITEWILTGDVKKTPLSRALALIS